MKCLRCGYCCHCLAVIIVDDPTKGPTDGNLIVHHGKIKPCKHLTGSKPGEFSCAVHDEPWYRKTPCFSHGQISASPDDVCRMGEAFMDGRLDPTLFLTPAGQSPTRG